MKCDQCPRDLVDGDEAYIQEYRQITVRGTKVRESIIDRIVCAVCAAGPVPDGRTDRQGGDRRA